MRFYSLCLAVTIALPVCAQKRSEPEPGRQAGDRLAPPSAVTCDRNQLTSYAGEVKVFRREPESIRISMLTDWDSVEEFTLFHPGEAGSSIPYLVFGEPMVSSDWARIEVEPGLLKPGIRAIAWVCSDPAHPPILDWRPGEPPD